MSHKSHIIFSGKAKYIRVRKQRTKISDTYREEICHPSPQDSILRPLVFNIDLCDFQMTLHLRYLEKTMANR